MIVLVEGCGTNLASIEFALKRLKKTFCVSACIEQIKEASHVIIPGVSTANRAIHQLERRSLIDTIKSLQQPVLGICSGMQILFNWSEEGAVGGLGVFPDKVIRISNETTVCVPHMGWNTLSIQKPECPLLVGVQEKDYVYFVHSYAAPIGKFTVASSEYGMIFSSVVARDNFFGTQFHPERSGKIGAKILSNFLEY